MYGNEEKNVESMKASHQKIPEHLKNPVKPPESLDLVWKIFWELSLGRDYYATGKARRLDPVKIETRLQYYGFNSYHTEEIKSIIMQMDGKFCDFDNAQFKLASQRAENSRS